MQPLTWIRTYDHARLTRRVSFLFFFVCSEAFIFCRVFLFHCNRLSFEFARITSFDAVIITSLSFKEEFSSLSYGITICSSSISRPPFFFLIAHKKRVLSFLPQRNTRPQKMSEHFRFFDLPLELRQSVYELYLQANLSLPTAQAQHESQSPPCPIPLFLTSKQTHDEISYILRHMQTLHMRVTWREMGFDPLALLCLKQRERRSGGGGGGGGQSTPTRDRVSVNYSTIKYLRIEIHSPSAKAGRRAGKEMIQILINTRKLCEDLRRTTPRLHNLAIEFIGTTWSDCLGRPQEIFEEQFRTYEILRCAQEGVSYNHHYPTPPPTCYGNPQGGHHDIRQCQLFDFVQTDVTSILDMFGLMANVRSAKIHLPESLKENKGLVRMKQIREDVLMNTDPCSPEAEAVRPRYWNTAIKLWSLA